jgi:hypothetical protein
MATKTVSEAELKAARELLKAANAEHKADVAERRKMAVESGIKPVECRIGDTVLTLKPITFKSGSVGLDGYGRFVIDGRSFTATIRLVELG